jgi:hypothetical protein
MIILNDLIDYFSSHFFITSLFFALLIAGYEIDKRIYDKWIVHGNTANISDNFRHGCSAYRIMCFSFFMLLYIYPLAEDVACIRSHHAELLAGEKYPSSEFYKMLLELFFLI